ncbi:MAG: metal ABC transporter solute-binding protein, Zn/Mn family [Planctomyces sp.]
MIPARLTPVTALFYAVLCFLLIGCSGGADSGNAPNTTTPEGPSAAKKKIKVLATVGMVADPVRQIGGDRVEVTQLMSAGVDPHLYQGNRDDVQAILDADVCFASGLMLEGRMNQTLQALSKRKPIFSVADLAVASGRLTALSAEAHPDPHLWMDVASWMVCAETIYDRLSEQDAEHSAEYHKRWNSYREELSQLHDYGLQCIGSIPEESRIMITSHDAFSYFGKAYGIEVLGVQGISTDSEAGLQRINSLVDLLVERSVAAVFVESSVPPKNIQALIDGAASRGKQIRIGGELFSDAMGAEGTYEGTYIGMMDHNITVITRALGGTAPEKGLNGRLAHTDTSAAPKSAQ